MSIIRNYKQDVRGSVPMMTAISMIVMIGAVGAAIDYSTGTREQGRTQDIADSIALKAAAFVREHDRAPLQSDKDGLQAGTYTAAELGYNNLKAASDVTFELVYDMDSGEARVSASGKSPTSFSQAMGYKSITIKSNSTASFVEKAVRDVASIALVLDNSGSMAWDAEQAEYRYGSWRSPSGAKTRMEVLKTSVSSFMSDLRTLVGSGSDQRIVRTAYAAFSGKNVTPKRAMAWQTMTDSELNSMRTSGGTYPDYAMRQANTWMTGEDRVHQQESGKTPLKYVIFLSDGENTQENQEWEEKSGTQKWRQEYRRREYWRYSKWSRWNVGWWYDYTRTGTGQNRPDNKEGTDWWYRSNYSKYEYDYEPWVEGDWSRPTDVALLAACNNLKAQDVKIYAIGFALEAGKYMSGSNSYAEIDQETTDHAYEALRSCATDDDTFIIAKDSADLEDAFATIGEDIMEEVIRVKS